MNLDIVSLARLQFTLTMMFHYLFPPLSIGLATVMVWFEAAYLRTRDPIYEQMTQFWAKIFAINFVLGVATGIVMEFQFGTNWAVYSSFVGDIFGSALAAEGIFAFFMESGFLAVMLFGWERVSPRIHFLSTVLVAFGAIFSAFWITVANSWQQIPTAFHLVRHGGVIRAELTNYWDLIFNPSSLDRFAHVIIGSWIIGAFFVLSISAYYLLRGRHIEFAKRSFVVTLIFACLVTPLQLLEGSRQARLVSHYQPAKLSAFEGIYQTGTFVPMWAFGVPNDKTQRVEWGIPIPGMLSFLATDHLNGKLLGRNDIPVSDRPPTLIPFEAYHIMISIGMYSIFISWLGLFLLWRKKLFQMRWMLWIFVLSIVLPYIANELGWVATEVGRQPWLVYGLLRTSQGVSTAVDAQSLTISLCLFGVLYILLFGVYFYSLNKKIQHGPDESAEPPSKPLHPPQNGWQSWFSLTSERVDPAHPHDPIEEA